MSTSEAKSGGGDRRELLKQAMLTISALQARLETAEQVPHEPIAIVGMGCRFPGGADAPAAFWQLLRSGVDAVGEVPADRWDADAWFDPDPDAPGKAYTRAGGFLGAIDGFDPQFFGIAPREAEEMDPQQRLLLEVAWEALEDGGLAPQGLAGSATGVFVGMTSNDFLLRTERAGGTQAIGTYVGTGTSHAVASGRLAYVLGLNGPAVTVDTACSSSLLAVHLACQSLRFGECRLALAGGVLLMLTPDGHVVASKGRMLSPSGRCRTFDASADGYVRAEGCGVVVLQRLRDAIAQGSRVLGVIRGTAANQDGRSGGLTAPSGKAQEAVMRQALADAGLDPGAIGYVETHGTGTELGDPIEVLSLGALHAGRDRAAPLVLGAVKSNLGHLEAAAGVAGLIKVVLALQHREIPPSLHFRRPNPHIPWDDLRLVVADQVRSWAPIGNRRLAGVSSFGFSGTNVHLVLEEAPPVAPRSSTFERPVHVLAISARTEGSLAALARSYGAALRHTPDDSVGDFCFTANAGRSHFEHRMAVVGGSAEQMAESLGNPKAVPGADVYGGRVVDHRPAGVAFLFTGQGSQYVRMGEALYETQPTFRRVLDRCAALLAAELDRSLLEVMFGATETAAALLDRTRYTQPALFALEYGLSELWRSWGVEPDVVIGHSVGEVVAACVAGVLSLEDGLRLVAARGRLMDALPEGGAMCSIRASEGHVVRAIEGYTDRVSIAAVNAPDQVVVSGAADAIRAVAGQLRAEGFQTTALNVSHAFHSPLMVPMLADFRAVVERLSFARPRISLIGNIHGLLVGSEVTDPEYWVRHVREGVRFADGMQALARTQAVICVEVGPQPVLCGLGRECLPGREGAWLPSMRKGVDTWQTLLASLGALYTRGVPIDWAGFDAPYARRRVALPTYPFDRQRFALVAPSVGGRGARPEALIHPLLGARIPLAGDQVVFERVLTVAELPYLGDHRAFGRVVLPASAHLVLLAAAAQAHFGVGSHDVTHVVFYQALVVAADDGCVVQTVLRVQGPDEVLAQVYSRPTRAALQEEWTPHASATLRRGAVDRVAHQVDLDAVLGRCPTPQSPESLYGRPEAEGVSFGPAFRGLADLVVGDHEAVGRLRAPAPIAHGLEDYVIHPALLDAALQAVAGAGLDWGEGTYLPFEVGRFWCEPAGADLWVHVAATAGSAEAVPIDLTLVAPGGAVLGRIEELRLKRASSAQIERLAAPVLDSQIYEVAWHTTTPPPGLPPADAGGLWVVIGHGVEATALRDALLSHGAPCVVVTPDPSVTGVVETAGHGYALESLSPSHARLLFERLSSDPRGLIGVVDLLPLELARDLEADLQGALGPLGGTLHLAQTLAWQSIALKQGTFCVTRGGAPVKTPASPPQAQLWGLGRVLATEHPELKPTLIDLDPASENPAADADLLVRELLWSDSENQVAYRRGERLVPRLVLGGRAAGELEVPAAASYQLVASERGFLESLRLEPVERREPGPGEVEIEVRAAGLNFRDIMNALGAYPGAPGALGAECAGKVTRVGAGVTRLRPGERVMALAAGGFRRFITLDQRWVAPQPRGLRHEQAATIPAVFLTAWFALRDLANLQPGEHVLVHSAAGGVGMAALQLARLFGARVYGTASPGKQDAVRSLGVEHVASSRSLDFAEVIREATAGHGVDVVLGALPGAFVDQGLGLLREKGRFLEMGKTDIRSPEDVARAYPGVTYRAFDLIEAGPDRIQAMLQTLVASFAAGELQPVPVRVFPIVQAQDAFRYMARTKHIGKIALTLQGGGAFVSPDATYLITGGLGALGQHVARWLVEEKGARNLVLVSRTAATADRLETVQRLRAAGANVRVAAIDVSNRRQLAAVLEDIPAQAPLRGVFHLAGLLADGVIVQQSPEQFEAVLAPKARGAWHLHELTRDVPLDIFCMFSAAAAIFGSPGQGNYAAANAFLDALAHYRAGQGLPALSINWGPWAGSGMAAAADSHAHQRWAEMGVEQLDPAAALHHLDHALSRPLPQVTIAAVRWQRVQQSLKTRMPLLEELIRWSQPRTAARTDTTRLNPILAAQGHEREVLLRSYLTDRLTNLLGLSASAIDPERSLLALGLDSLMAMELRNRIQGDLGLVIRVGDLLEGPSVQLLARKVASHLESRADLRDTNPSARRGDSPGSAQQAEALLGQLGGLSDEDVDRLVKDMLAQKGAPR